MGLELRTRQEKLLIACAVVVVTPFLLLTFYNFPSADDFWYANKARELGVWPAQLDFYRTWSGRFLSTLILSVSPLTTGSIIGYKILSAVNILGFFSAVAFFVRRSTSRLGLKKHFLSIFLIVAVILVAAFPGVNEGFYWMSGYVNYTWSITLILILAGLLIQPKTLRSNFLIALLCIAIVGLNETTMFQLLVFWSCLVFFNMLRKRKIFDRNFWFGAITLASALVVVAAPGNQVRRAYFQPVNPLKAVWKSIFGSALEHVVHFANVPLIAAGLLLIFHLSKNSIPELQWLNKIKTRYLFLGLILVMAVGYFPAQLSMGGGGSSRMDNIIYVEFVSIFAVCLTGLTVRHKSHPWILKIGNFNPNLILTVFVVSSLLWTNTRSAWMDLLFRSQPYETANQERIRLMKSNPGGDVTFQDYPIVPKSLFFGDIGANPNDAQNAAKFFNVHSIRVIK